LVPVGKGHRDVWECSRPATAFTSAHAPRIFPRRIHRIQTPTSDRVRPPSVAKPERSPPSSSKSLPQTHEHECASSGEGAMAGASCQQTAAVLRLQSDLKAIKTEPPDVSFHPPRAHRRARFVARGGRAPLPHNPRSKRETTRASHRPTVPSPASTVPLTIDARNSIRHDRDAARALTATIIYSSGAPRSSARTRQPGKVSGVSSQPQ